MVNEYKTKWYGIYIIAETYDGVTYYCIQDDNGGEKDFGLIRPTEDQVNKYRDAAYKRAYHNL